MEYYRVFRIDEHTWRLEDIFRSYMYLLEGENKAVLIDTGNGFPGLAKRVKELTEKPVSVINTHGHLDHIGGNDQLDGTDIYMMEEDIPVAAEHMEVKFRKSLLEGFAKEFGTDLPVGLIGEICAERTGTFQRLVDGQIIDLGGRELEVIHTPGHTRGSICILDKGRRELFSSDTVCAEGVLLFFDHSASVTEYVESIHRLKNRGKEYDRIWPGHHEAPLDLSWTEEYERCALQIIRDPKCGTEIHSNLGKGRQHGYGRIALSYMEERI